MPQSTRVPHLLVELGHRLHAAGYEAPILRPLLERGIPDITAELVPGLARRCRDADSLAARLVAFWLLLQPMPRPELDLLLGTDVVRGLEDVHLVERVSTGSRARASLVPFMGGHFLADPLVPTGSPRDLPWLTESGYALALVTPRSPGQDALDLHLGPGIPAVLNATHHQSSWGVPESPRAAEFCRMNAWLNAVDGRCRFVDRTSDVCPGPFDLITGRMPAAPPSAGEDVTLVRRLADRLRVGGTLALAVRHFTPDRPLLERVERWLGGGAGWGLGHLNYGTAPLDPSLGSYGTSSEEGVLGAAGFDAAAEALLFIRRLPPAHPGWQRAAPFTCPRESASDVVGDWLDAQERFSGTGWQESWEDWRPQWSHTARLFVDPRSGLGVAHYVHGLQPAALDPTSTLLLDRVDGRKTARDLVQECAGPGDGPAVEVAARLGELGQLALIR